MKRFLLLLIPFAYSYAAADIAATLQLSAGSVPLGGMAQVRISLASPQAIATGVFSLDFDPAFFGDIADVQIFSAAGDALGMASIKGTHVDVRFSSPSAGVGRLPSLPIATIAIPVLPTVASGATVSLGLTPSAEPWKSYDGARYVFNVTPGSITAGASLSIQNVTPGGGLLPAGSTIRIQGSGFAAGSVADVPGVAIAATTYVSPSAIDVTLNGPAELTGKRVSVRNPDGAVAEFLSSLRTQTVETSATRLLPIFPLRTLASINAGLVPCSLGGTRGIALLNQNPAAVDVQVEKLNLFGGLSGRQTLTLAPEAVVVIRNLYELGVEIQGSAGLLPSQPIRAVSLSNGLYDGNAPPVVSEVLSGYTKFGSNGAQLNVSPSLLSFRFQTGTALPDPQNFYVYSNVFSSDGVDFTTSVETSSGGNWLSVTPSQGTVQATSPTLSVRVDPSRLTPGTYTGTITVKPAPPESKVSTATVTLLVSANPFVEISGLTNTSFTVSPGDPAPPGRTFEVKSTSTPFAFTVKTMNGGNWLIVSPSSATTPATITYSVNPAGLPLGYQSGSILIQGPSTTETINISLGVLPLPPPPKLESLTLTAWNLSVELGKVTFPRTTSVIVNPFRVTFNLAATTDSGGNWLSAMLSTAGAGNVFEVKADPTSLSPGTYTGKVTVTSSVATGTLILPVTLTVWTGTTPPLAADPPSLTLIGDVDKPPQQTFVVTSGGLPLPVSLKSDIAPNMCGLSAFTSQDPTPATVQVNCPGSPGDYDGTVTATAGTSSIVVPVSIHIAPGAYHGLTTPPIVGSTVSAASSLSDAVSPGEILAIHGVGIGPAVPLGIVVDTAGNVSRNLGGFRVLFDGIAAPLLYTSLFQTNVIVPYEIDGKRTVKMQIESNGTLYDAPALPVRAAVPAIFSANSSGGGQAAVLNADNSANSAANPALRGSVIQIFATGEGQTVPGGVTGTVIQSNTKNPLQRTTASIGGVDAQVMYSGSAPQAVSGLFQVNVVVPQSVQPGEAVPLTLKIGDTPTQTGITVAVQ